jgi:uncharacterized membrane protein
MKINIWNPYCSGLLFSLPIWIVVGLIIWWVMNYGR